MTLFLDLETQYLAAEVGGWANIESLRLAVACTFDERAGYRDWCEAQAGDLLAELRQAEQVVGFNLNAFDYRVLSLYGQTAGLEAKTFDLHEHVRQQTGKRVALNTLAVLNLGEGKVFESGVQAVMLWKAGRLEELTAYCRKDVELTKRLFEFWQAQGLLWISGHEYAVWPGK
jgi:DEAD/DEAH box helicase domain-containing protein